MHQIKNIIFDFGGVFIDVDYHRTEAAFIDAGIPKFNALYSQQAASPLFEQLEKGEVEDAIFFDRLRMLTGTNLDNETIVGCWNRILGKYYPEAIEWLRQVRQRYRVFLFSNTNAIHHKCFTQIYREQFGEHNFDDLFEKTYYSHLVGQRKPYPEAYEWVVADAGIIAKETLFIDDTAVNIEGASRAGLQVLHLVPPMKIWELEL